jgi:PmbA protein
MGSHPAHQEILSVAASTGRDLLAHSGAVRWEIFVKASRARQVEARTSAPPKIAQVEEAGVAVRTLRDGRSGFGAASGPASSAVRRAVEGSLNSQTPVPFDPLPPPRLLGTAEAPAARAPAADGWPAHATEMLGAALVKLSQGAIELRRSILQEGAFSWFLMTAEDFVASYHNTTMSLLAEVQLGGQRTGVWRDWFHIPDPERFDPEAAASRIADRALLTSHGVTTDSGLRDLILDPEVTAQLLASMSPLFVATPVDADPLHALLNADGLLASPALTVVDDRSDSTAPIIGPCDGEGLPARRTLLVDGGVPRHRIASYRDAVAYSEIPRGGALRLSYRDYPTTGFANLRVETDDGLTPVQLLDAADHALYLLRPLAPIILDLVNDAYRIVASGVWLHGRHVRGWHPVVELQGSVTRLLRHIEAVGTDLAWFQTERGCVGAPSLLIRRQPVVG